MAVTTSPRIGTGAAPGSRDLPAFDPRTASPRAQNVWARRMANLRVFGRSPLSAYLRVNRRVWYALPESIRALGPVREYGVFLNRLVRLDSVRGQLLHTFFLRNRPALALVRRLAERIAEQGDTVRVAVLGCSAGAEAYSVAWAIRSGRPDLRLVMQAVDISERAVEVARNGVYSAAHAEVTGTNLFDGMSAAEMAELFDRNGDAFTIKAWIKEGITWRVGDVANPEVLELLGQQDIVLANNFLCHMTPALAENCLRNIAHVVRPNGFLLVSGIDLDIRTKVATELGWQPLQELIEEIHQGDPRMSKGWPWNYSSLEPLNKRRRDWRHRYAAAFQLVSS